LLLDFSLCLFINWILCFDFKLTLHHGLHVGMTCKGGL
jgi:hypothetical protein